MKGWNRLSRIPWHRRIAARCLRPFSKDWPYSAQPGMQRDLPRCPADIVLVGGARASGKTLACLAGDWQAHMDVMGKDAVGLVVQKGPRELTHVIKDVMRFWGNRIAVTTIDDVSGTIIFRNQAKLHFSSVEAACRTFMPDPLSWVMVRRANLLPRWEDLEPILKSLHGPGERRVVLTAHPDGPGVDWLYKRFVRANPSGRRLFQFERSLPYSLQSVISGCFIPGTIKDNPALLKMAPEFLPQLANAVRGNKELERAWTLGEWPVD